MAEPRDYAKGIDRVYVLEIFLVRAALGKPLFHRINGIFFFFSIFIFVSQSLCEISKLSVRC